MPYLLTAVLLLLVIVAAVLLPKTKTPQIEYSDAKTLITDLASLFKNRNAWLMLFYIGLLSAPITGFVALWGIPFFMQMHHWSRDLSASLIATSWVGGLFGGPIIGFLADRFRIHKMMMVIVGGFAAIIMLSLLLIPLTIALTGILLFILGVLCNGNVIVFDLMCGLVSTGSVGVANGITNTFNILAGPVFQVLCGFLIADSAFKIVNHVPVYSTQAYQHALLFIPFCLLLANILILIFYRSKLR